MSEQAMGASGAEGVGPCDPGMPDEREIIRHGSYMVDANTGEVLGLVPEKAKFRVHDAESADWVMSLLFDEEDAIGALDRRLAILTKNIESMKADHERRASWVRLRFGAELEAWAALNLAGKKTKTWKSAYGRLSFRRKKARLSVHDTDRALQWAMKNQPGAVETHLKLLVSKLDPHLVRDCIGTNSPPPGMAIEPESESFSVKTGVEAVT